MGEESRGGAGGPAHSGSTESCTATFPVSQVQGGHASTGLGDGRNIQQGLYGGGGGGHGPVGFAKIVDELGREIKQKTEREAKTDDARYVADLIAMLRWTAECSEVNHANGTEGPPLDIVAWYNCEVTKELIAFYERYKK